MRDDIHRSLPLSRPWKRLVKECGRAASAPFRVECAEAALAAEGRKLTASFVRHLKEALASSQHSLFPVQELVDVEPDGSIEIAVFRHCLVLVDRRLCPEETLAMALGEALHDQGQAQLREIEAHVRLKETPANARLLGEHARNSIGKVNLRKLATGLLDPTIKLSRAKARLDLDMDLRLPS